MVEDNLFHFHIVGCVAVGIEATTDISSSQASMVDARNQNSLISMDLKNDIRYIGTTRMDRKSSISHSSIPFRECL